MNEMFAGRDSRGVEEQGRRMRTSFKGNWRRMHTYESISAIVFVAAFTSSGSITIRCLTKMVLPG